jgi:hypothetical protein
MAAGLHPSWGGAADARCNVRDVTCAQIPIPLVLLVPTEARLEEALVAVRRSFLSIERGSGDDDGGRSPSIAPVAPTAARADRIVQ